MCSVTCGVCSELVAFLNYSIPGVPGVTVNQSLHRTCSVNDTACVRNAQQELAVGAVVGNAWIDPSAPSLLLLGLQVRPIFAVLAAVCAAATLVPYGLMVYIAYNRTPAEPTVPRRSQKYMDAPEDPTAAAEKPA